MLLEPCDCAYVSERLSNVGSGRTAPLLAAESVAGSSRRNCAHPASLQTVRLNGECIFQGVKTVLLQPSALVGVLSQQKCVNSS
jgi:hypothetical protein